ncbi:MAG: hypothetical protein P1Q69_12835, partial [Candidatus Thorarchaeota archaeon]|nr:hypothetical protein [Candidatus Thorarchaeota archaeon]
IGKSVLDESLKSLLWAGLSVSGVISDMRGGPSRNTSFMFQEGFSFFQFTSDHFTNLILTQMTFMIVGGILTAGGGLRSAVTGAAESFKDPATFAKLSAWQVFTKSWSILGRQGLLDSTLKTYIIHTFEHLAMGAMFLYTLGAIGSAFGDAGLFAELILQGAMLASIVVNIYSTHMTGKLSPESRQELFTYLESVEGISKYVPGIREVVSLKNAYSALGIMFKSGSKAQLRTVITALSLQLASMSLQMFTVGAVAFAQ